MTALREEDRGGVPPESAGVMNVVEADFIVVILIAGTRSVPGEHNAGAADMTDLVVAYTIVDSVQIESNAPSAAVLEEAIYDGDVLGAPQPHKGVALVVLLPVMLKGDPFGRPAHSVSVAEGDTRKGYVP